MTLSPHLVVLPIIVPLMVGAALMVIDERRRRVKFLVSELSAIAVLGVGVTLLLAIDSGAMAEVTSYRVGAWSSSIGIVLVVDRLAALMLVLTGLLAIPSIAFATVRWQRAGPRFQTLLQLLLMGLNGAFLTGDVFNLFVFFEVLLAASYGLALHGSGRERVRAGLHYVAINLVGSSLLLVGISLLYGVTGTLNMAELGLRIPALMGEERALVESGAAVLGVAFLIKAGAWPLSFWLPGTYGAASAPVAALFAIMTKVGVYALLRLSALFFPAEGAGAAVGFGDDWMLVAGLLTIVYGMNGALGSRTMARLAGYCAIISSGTLITIIGTGSAAAIGGGLYYLVASTLGVAALFLLVELVERERDPGNGDYLPVLETTAEDDEMEPGEEEIGIAIPGMLAVLGVALVAATLVVAGMPPFPGFVGKIAMIHALLDPAQQVAGEAMPMRVWVVMGALIISGLAVLVALTRVGINEIWARAEDEVPPIQTTDFGAIVFLLLVCFVMTVRGGPIMRYMDETAQSLRSPRIYIENVVPDETAVAAGEEGP